MINMKKKLTTDNLKILFVYANCMMENLIPVGVSSLLGALRKAGFDVKLFDTTFYQTESIPADIERVKNLQILPFSYEEAGISVKQTDVFNDFRCLVQEHKPDLIMISLVESTYEQGINLLNSIGDERPYTVAGGIFTILSPEETISNKCIDVVCVGEGEDVIVDFCRAYAGGGGYLDMPGMWFKINDGIRKNPIAKLVDLDNAPFLDFSLYEKERFYKPMQGKIFKMVPVEFSRGCPYRCSYCVNHALERHFVSSGRWFRSKSIDRIFKEIEEYVNSYKVDFFYFVSESFLSMPPDKFDEFCERYSEYKIPFWFNTRPETITKEIVGKLEKINCFRMGIGLEHGNEEFRKKILNRHVSNQRIIEACKIVESSKIGYSINNMIGFPGETRELIFDTIELNRQIRPNTVGTFIFTPFKGTDLYKYCLENGHINTETKVGDLNRLSILKESALSDAQIKGLLRTFPLYVHFNKRYYPEIRKAECFTEEGDLIFKKLANIYINEHFRKDEK